MKYAWSPQIQGDFEKWTLTPWLKFGLQTFDTLAQIPDSHVLVASHYAPWWPGLREWIQEGRPWIEIEYGYWGRDEKTRQTRRVTYCGHHNLNMGPRPWPRSLLFKEPAQQSWRKTPGKYVVAIQPIAEIFQQRTGQSIVDWQHQTEAVIQQYWSGPIVWKPKTGSRRTRFEFYKKLLEDAHAVVGERTMACAEAIMLGVPAYSLDKSICTLLTGGIENLANPTYPDRTDWWDHICWSQFHNHEFQTDAPARLVEMYQIQR